MQGYDWLDYGEPLQNCKRIVLGQSTVNGHRYKNAGKDHPGVGKGSSGAGKDPKVAGKEPKGKHKSDIAKMFDEINRTCTVLICDDKSAVMDKANKIHRIIQKVIKQLDADSRKQLQALMVKLQGKIFNKTSTGVKELLIDAAKVMKASEKK